MKILASNGMDEQWYDFEEHNYNPFIVDEIIDEELGEHAKITDFSNTWGIKKSYLTRFHLSALCNFAEEIEHFKIVLADFLESVDGNVDLEELCNAIKLNSKGDVK